MKDADADRVRELARAFIEDGVVVSGTRTGKRLFIVSGSRLGIEEDHVLLTMEHGGSLVWDGVRPLNAFRLISAGFDGDVAATLSGVLNVVENERRRGRLEETRLHGDRRAGDHE